MGVTYIVNGVEVDPNGQPVNKGELAPHSWIPTVRDTDLDPSPGEISAAAAKGAPNSRDFDSSEEYEVARQEHEANVAQNLLAQRRLREGRDPETGEVLVQQELSTGEPADDTSEEGTGKSGAQAAKNEAVKPAPASTPEVVPASTTPTNAAPPGETAAQKKAREDAAKNQGS